MWSSRNRGLEINPVVEDAMTSALLAALLLAGAAAAAGAGANATAGMLAPQY